VRNALILLAVVALLILTVGALNNGTAFDVDYVAGTVSAVSLFWVSVVLAALVFVVGLAAAWFAQAAVAGTRRKLEAELQSTYERLREAEARAARPAPVVLDAVPVVAVAPAEEPVVVADEVTAVAAEHATAAAENVTIVAGEDATIVAGEDATMVAGDEATVVADEPAAVVAEAPEAVATTAAEPGERTAVTMAGSASDDGQTAADGAAGAGAAGPDDEEPASSGS
jgi:uncharacterized membrane protein YciS (DUF1049 family)